MLSKTQVEEYSVHYSALLAWAEITHREAASNSPSTLAFILAQPSADCAREHRAYRNRTLLGHEQPPDSWVDYVLNCAAEDFNSQTAQLTANWQAMNQEERTARATRSLNQLWAAIDPAVYTQAMLVFNRSILPDPVNEPAFGEFADLYLPCQDQIPEAATVIANPLSTDIDISRTWLEQSHHMATCSNTLTEQRFPLPNQQQPEQLQPEQLQPDQPRPPQSAP